MKLFKVLSIAFITTKCARSHTLPPTTALTPGLPRDSAQEQQSAIHQPSSFLNHLFRITNSQTPQLRAPPPPPPPIKVRTVLSARTPEDGAPSSSSSYGDDNSTSAYLYAQAHHLPGGYRTTPSTPLARHNFALAHGTLMALTFTLYFPLGAAIMHVWHAAHWHAAVQVFAYANAVAGLGLGVWLGRNVRYLDYAHTVIGMAVVAALVVQVGVGVVAHGRRRSGGGGGGEGEGEGPVAVVGKGKGSVGGERKPVAAWKARWGWRFVHRWVGRGLIALGIINGGLGLKLAQNTTGGKIAYGVVAGVVGVAYLALLFVTMWRKRRAGKEETMAPQSLMLS